MWQNKESNSWHKGGKKDKGGAQVAEWGTKHFICTSICMCIYLYECTEKYVQGINEHGYIQILYEYKYVQSTYIMNIFREW